MTEIVNCPFCGGIATVGGLVPWVECQSCGASGPQKTTEAEAITAWNTRHGAGDAEDAPAIEPCMGAEKAESLCVHCFSPPHMWGMICCKGYWNDPRTEMLTETQARAKRAARAGERGGA